MLEKCKQFQLINYRIFILSLYCNKNVQQINVIGTLNVKSNA